MIRAVVPPTALKSPITKPEEPSLQAEQKEAELEERQRPDSLRGLPGGKPRYASWRRPPPEGKTWRSVNCRRPSLNRSTKEYQVDF